MNLVDEIVAASVRPQRTFEWMLEMPRASEVHTMISGKPETTRPLWGPNSSALARVAPADLQRILHTKRLDAMKDGKMIADRQIF